MPSLLLLLALLACCLTRSLTHSSLSPEVLEVAREYTAATQVDLLTTTSERVSERVSDEVRDEVSDRVSERVSEQHNFITPSHTCPPHSNTSYVLYLLYNSECVSEGVSECVSSDECLKVLQNQWEYLCVTPPESVFLVHSLTYSPPLQSLSASKTHIATLTHYVMQHRVSERENASVVMILDLTHTNSCLHTTHSLTHSHTHSHSVGSDLTTALESISSTKSLIFLTTPLHYSRGYLTTVEFLETTLLQELVTTTTLHEYTAEPTHSLTHSLEQYLQELSLRLNTQVMSVSVFTQKGMCVCVCMCVYMCMCVCV
jgi:hypothetical protein